MTVGFLDERKKGKMSFACYEQLFGSQRVLVTIFVPVFIKHQKKNQMNGLLMH